MLVHPDNVLQPPRVVQLGYPPLRINLLSTARKPTIEPRRDHGRRTASIHPTRQLRTPTGEPVEIDLDMVPLSAGLSAAAAESAGTERR